MGRLFRVIFSIKWVRLIRTITCSTVTIFITTTNLRSRERRLAPTIVWRVTRVFYIRRLELIFPFTFTRITFALAETVPEGMMYRVSKFLSFFFNVSVFHLHVSTGSTMRGRTGHTISVRGWRHDPWLCIGIHVIIISGIVRGGKGHVDTTGRRMTIVRRI